MTTAQLSILRALERAGGAMAASTLPGSAVDCEETIRAGWTRGEAPIMGPLIAVLTDAGREALRAAKGESNG